MTSVDPRGPSPFQSFNARSLPAYRVAETFIPPQQFEALVARQHHLLIGPRGSGKTTLLKMLQTPALEAWDHATAYEYRQKIDFTGVFIPTDIAWLSQLQSLRKQGFSAADAETFARALFTANSLRSLVGAMRHRIHPDRHCRHEFRRLHANEELEGNFVKALAHEWNVAVGVPSLAGLSLALSSRLMQIGAFAHREVGLGVDGRSERIASAAALHMNFLQAASVFADAVELYFPSTSDERWGLLFDELELAPDSIRNELIGYLRSVDPRFIFKLSLSPYTSNLSDLPLSTSAMSGHDHLEINLTYANAADSYSFCRDLFMRIAADAGIEISNPSDLLGSSVFGPDDHHLKRLESEYRKSGRLGKLFSELYRGDESFRSYIDSHNIDIDSLDQLDPGLRDKTIRKVRSLVTVRATFRSDDTRYAASGRRTRGRKNPQLYSGDRSIFAMAEGNPRWLIGLTTRLLGDLGPRRVLPANAQSRETSLLANRFRALLKTIPTAGPPGRHRGLLSVLDPIGQFIHDGVVRRPFDPDPAGSFIVDSDTAEWLVDSLGKALNAGAIVYVPDSEASSIVASIRGKRFRLSYALAPHYEIPLLLLRPVSLSSILNKSAQDTLDFTAPEVGR